MIVIVDIDVVGPVIVAVHLNGNDTVVVIGSPLTQGSIILIGIAATLSSSSTPRPCLLRTAVHG